MRVVIQRSQAASVKVNEEIIGQIDSGLVLLVGFTADDTEEDVDYCVRKVSKMRIFEDEAGKMNLAIDQVGGSILSVSQFTLYANTRKGNRPSFIEAMEPAESSRLYDLFNEKLRQAGLTVETGEFGAMMEVQLVNDGPVTILLDTHDK